VHYSIYVQPIHVALTLSVPSVSLRVQRHSGKVPKPSLCRAPEQIEEYPSIRLIIFVAMQLRFSDRQVFSLGGSPLKSLSKSPTFVKPPKVDPVERNCEQIVFFSTSSFEPTYPRYSLAALAACTAEVRASLLVLPSTVHSGHRPMSP